MEGKIISIIFMLKTIKPVFICTIIYMSSKLIKQKRSRRVARCCCRLSSFIMHSINCMNNFLCSCLKKFKLVKGNILMVMQANKNLLLLFLLNKTFKIKVRWWRKQNAKKKTKTKTKIKTIYLLLTTTIKQHPK